METRTHTNRVIEFRENTPHITVGIAGKCLQTPHSRRHFSE